MNNGNVSLEGYLKQATKIIRGTRPMEHSKRNKNKRTTEEKPSQLDTRMGRRCPNTGRKKFLFFGNVPCVLLLRQSDLDAWSADVLLSSRLVKTRDLEKVQNAFGFNFAKLPLPVNAKYGPLQKRGEDRVEISVLDAKHQPTTQHIENKDVCSIPDAEFEKLLAGLPLPDVSQLAPTDVQVTDIYDYKKVSATPQFSYCQMLLKPGQAIPSSVILPAFLCRGHTASSAVLVRMTFPQATGKNICRLDNPQDYQLLLQQENLSKEPAASNAIASVPRVRWR